jgi:signal transduction histidine kinase
VTVRSKDEFGELAESFNVMVEKLQETQEELVRKEKLAMLGQVAGSVGHELRNPLGVMSNAVYFLQTVLEGRDERVKEYLGIILAEINRSEHIVDELLAAVRIRPPDAATHGVAELVCLVLRQCVVPGAVTVTLEIPETIPPLRVDALQIQQVLKNLISNGVEAMPEGGTLVIRALENRQDGTVCLSMQDSGSGMPPEVLARLFQPLFTTKARGIGLGLVVVKNLTEANGGHIEVQSEPGLGTTFSIILPGDYQEGNQHA